MCVCVFVSFYIIEFFGISQEGKGKNHKLIFIDMRRCMQSCSQYHTDSAYNVS